MRYILFLLFLIPSFSYGQKRFKLPPDLNEVSGLYIADSDSLYWHNDSGNSNELFLTNAKGKIQKRIVLPNTINRDWEDITADDKGNIYIGDFGNNRNRRKDLRIYVYSPDNQVDSILFSYPNQTKFPPEPANWKFDMEGFFWYNNQLHLFSKNTLKNGDYQTQHYTLHDQPSEQIAVLKNSLVLPKRVATAAAISADGQTVVLLAYYYNRIFGFIPWSRASIFTFTDYPEGDYLAGKMRKRNIPVFVLATQFESIDFIDNDYVLVASERTVFIRPKAKRVKIKR